MLKVQRWKKKKKSAKMVIKAFSVDGHLATLRAKSLPGNMELRTKTKTGS